jgi:serine protease AprX
MSNPRSTAANQRGEVVSFEAVVRSDTGASMFAVPFTVQRGNLPALAPTPGRASAAAAELQRLGFRIRHVGTFSVSGEGPRELWERTFQTRLKPETGSRQERYLRHLPDTPFQLPASLEPLIERAYPQRPPMFFTTTSAKPARKPTKAANPAKAAVSPLPPRVGYHHLRVPDDVSLVLRSTAVHERGITGRGVLVAMPDTGFFQHPFYAWHGYNFQATLAPDATGVEHDEYGHGTAEAANIFAAARDVDFIGVKMGDNPTLAFKAAADLCPAVMTNSWGFDLPGVTELPNYLRPLEAAVVEAVRDRGITVCFSAGNGQISFPGMMPEVISVGGVYATETVDGTDFQLTASDYASSFDSLIYPGRHVPDVCGLVGRPPLAVYLMLPVEPGNTIDAELAGSGAYPDGDDTAADDGWAVISGTSAASPQVAGVCALLKQARPELRPDLVKAILKASARDVTDGQSAMGEPAGDGHDGATGAGLVDALAAYRLARSVNAA